MELRSYTFHSGRSCKGHRSLAIHSVFIQSAESDPRVNVNQEGGVELEDAILALIILAGIGHGRRR